MKCIGVLTVIFAFDICRFIVINLITLKSPSTGGVPLSCDDLNLVYIMFEHIRNSLVIRIILVMAHNMDLFYL